MATFRELWRNRKRFGIDASVLEGRKVILCYNAVDTFLPMINYKRGHTLDDVMNEATRLLLCVSPPFPRMFLEGKVYGKIVGFLIDQIGGDCGVPLRETLTTQIDIPPKWESIISLAERRAIDPRSKWTIAVRRIEDDQNGMGVSWVSLNEMGAPIDFNDGHPVVLTVSYIDWLDNQIRIDTAKTKEIRAGITQKALSTGRHDVIRTLEALFPTSDDEPDDAPPPADMSDICTIHLILALLCIQTMHCTNADLPESDYVFHGKRNRNNTDACPVTRYSTLVITKTFGRAEKREAGDDDAAQEAQKALHFARGHFKDFREGKGLFGKYKSLYWWGPQLRGHADRGVVVSEYTTA